MVVTAGYDQSIRCWDTRSNSFDAIQVVAPFKDSVTSLALHGSCILAGSVDGTVRCFDVRAGRCTSDELGAPVTVISLSRDGACVLAALAGASRLRLLDREGGALLAEYGGGERGGAAHVNRGSRCGAALTADDARVCAGGEDGRVHIWELVDAAVEAVVDAHPGKTVRRRRSMSGATSALAQSDTRVRMCAPNRCVALTATRACRQRCSRAPRTAS